MNDSVTVPYKIEYVCGTAPKREEYILDVINKETKDGSSATYNIYVNGKIHKPFLVISDDIDGDMLENIIKKYGMSRAKILCKVYKDDHTTDLYVERLTDA